MADGNVLHKIRMIITEVIKLNFMFCWSCILV